MGKNIENTTIATKFGQKSRQIEYILILKYIRSDGFPLTRVFDPGNLICYVVFQFCLTSFEGHPDPLVLGRT